MEEFNQCLKLANEAIERSNKHINNVKELCVEIIELQTIRESKNEFL